MSVAHSSMTAPHRQRVRVALGAATAVIVLTAGLITPYSARATTIAPTSEVVAAADTYLASNFVNFFDNDNGGSDGDLKRTTALFTLARNFAAGDTNPNYKSRLVSWVGQTLNNPAHMPDMHAGIDMRQQQFYLLTLNIIWRTAGLKSAFTTADQARIMLMAKAAVASTAYVTSDYTPTGAARADSARITMDGDPNCWPQGNPNWTEAVVGSLIAGSYIVGLSNVGAFVNGYSHAAFKSELSSAGLSNVYNTFNMTADATVNGYLNNIDNNQAAGKPFFRGVSLTRLATDTYDFYYQTTGKHTFTLAATEGDGIGALGRAAEFGTTDAYGLRDALGYVIHGVNANLGNTYMLEFQGVDTAASATAPRADLEARTAVGVSDMLGKATNGYWSRLNGMNKYQSSANAIYYQFFAGLAFERGYLKTVTFNDSFESSSATNWVSTGTWTFENTQTWSGSTAATEKVLSAATASANSTRIAKYSASQYAVYTALRVPTWSGTSSARIGIVGKYIDANNYYFLGYDRHLGKMVIVRVQNGVSTTLASRTWDLFSGATHQFKASFAADGRLSLYVDAVSTPLTAVDTSLSAGSPGLLAKGVSSSFDDFLVAVQP